MDRVDRPPLPPGESDGARRESVPGGVNLLTLGHALPGGRGGRSTIIKREQTGWMGPGAAPPWIESIRFGRRATDREVLRHAGRVGCESRHDTARARSERDHRASGAVHPILGSAQAGRAEERQAGPDRAGRGFSGGDEGGPGIGPDGKCRHHAPALRAKRRGGGGGRSRTRIARRALQARAGRDRNPRLVIIAGRHRARFGQKVELRDAGPKLMAQRAPLGANRRGSVQRHPDQKREQRSESSECRRR